MRGPLLLLALILGFASPLFADDEPVQVKGDKVEYFDTLQKITASGNVVATYRGSKLTADQATIFMSTKDAYLTGNVTVIQGAYVLRGENVLYNFETKKGVILAAQLTAEPFRAAGESAHKVSATEYQFRKGYISTCDFDDPHTRLQAKEITVYLDDRVVLKHAVLYVGHVPLMYIPSYTYPLDDKRPRVTLIPGYKKDWGGFLLSSWRAYVNEDIQGRILLDARAERGIAGGANVQYRVPNAGNGIVRSYFTEEGDYLSLQNDDSGGVKKQYRERIQVRHVADMDRYTKATLEVHQQSDASVVRDFFEDEFEENQNPQTYFQIIRSTPWYGLTFLVTQRVNTFETVTQQWPQLDLQIRPLPIPWLPSLGLSPEERTPRGANETGTSRPGWYYQSNWNYVHRNTSSVDRNLENSRSRIGTVQEVFYLTKVLNFLNLRPFAQFQHTTFTRSAAGTDNLFRQAGAFGVDMSTRFFRVFDIDAEPFGIKLHDLRHIINPTVTYAYQTNPTVPPSDLFAGEDAVSKGNRITPSIEQKLQTKRLIDNVWQAVDIARFVTSFNYNLEGAGGAGGELDNIGLDLETRPYRWLYFESDATFNPHDTQFETINFDIVATPQRDEVRSLDGSAGRREFSTSAEGFREVPWGVGVGWRYQRHISAQMVFETEFDLDAKWRVGIYQAFDVKRFVTEVDALGTTRTVKRIYDFPDHSFRLRRDLHEWTAELVLNQARGEGAAVLLLFRLKDFPDLPIDFQQHYSRPKSARGSY